MYKNMNKYLTLFSLSWQNGFVYRMSLLIWRLRQFLSSFMALTVWSVFYQADSTSLNYTHETMITYIFLVGVLQSLIMATSLHGLADRIYSGDFSNDLLKPVNYFAYFFTQELADKSKNVFFIIVETTLLYLIFKPTIIFPPAGILLLFLLWSILGMLMNFCVSLLFGALGFWSPETWGPRFLFFILIDLTAGKLFPLDILPATIQKVLLFTPAPYLSFMQTQLFLERVPQTEMHIITGKFILWLAALTLLVKLIWRKGIKIYGAMGR